MANGYRKGAKGVIYDSEGKRAYGPEEARLEAEASTYRPTLKNARSAWARGVKSQKAVNRLHGLSKKNPVNPQGIDKYGHGNDEQFDTANDFED